jgi:quinol monooxygenase YgiN
MTRRIAAVLVFAVMLVPFAGAQSVPESNPPAEDSGRTSERSTMRYGLSGKMVTKPGQRDAVVAILLRDVDEMKAVGCDLYVVSVSKDHPDAIYITEVWVSKEAHGASLKLPSVKQAIAEAMPMLTGEFESVELSVVGGLGVPK